MNKNKIKLNSGFTLFETIIYLAIFGFFISGFLIFVNYISDTRARNSVLLEVKNQGEIVVNFLSQNIRNATSVVSPGLSSSAVSLSVNTNTPANNPTVFYEDQGFLYMTEAGGPPIQLTNSKVKIEGLNFENLGRAGTDGVIRVRFTLKNNDNLIKDFEQYSVDFYTTASLR